MFFLVLLCQVLGIVILISSLWWCIQYYWHFKGVLNIPTPGFVVPVFGNLFEVRHPSDAFWILHKLTMTVGKGKLLRGSIGFFFGINIADPEFLQHIMTHTSAINKSTLYRFFHSWLGFGLLTSSDDKWRSRRKLLTPAYHFKILEQFIDLFDKNSTILVEQLQSEIGNARSNIFPYISLCALDTICETAMGTSVNAQLNSNSEFVRATKEMNRIVVARGVSLIKQIDFTYQFTEDYRIEKQSLEVLHSYTMSVITSRRKELINAKNIEKQSKQEQEDNEAGCQQKVPFLDLLLQSSINGVPLSNEDIREEVDTFMFEGHDTVSAAMSFCIYCISNHPHIQEKLIQEQREIYGNNPDRHTTYNDLQEMQYLEMVIKETLRLYPSVPLYGRIVTEDIKYRDYVIKKGTQLAIGVYSLHRNADIYPDPEIFDPERFTAENQAKRHPFSYIPFSAGFRNCVGQKFAMLEMKSTISKLLRNYVFTEAPDNKLKLMSETILTSGTGVVVKINQRIW